MGTAGPRLAAPGALHLASGVRGGAVSQSRRILNHPSTHKIGDDMIHKLAEHWGFDYAELQREALAAVGLLSEKNRPGYGTTLALASVLHITVDELLNGVAPSPPARTVELDDRYPSRAAARAVARSGGLPSAAIAEVDGSALGASDDPGVFFWIDQYRAAAARLALSTHARADTAAGSARTRPRLPRR
jgi:hypothetical protein